MHMHMLSHVKVGGGAINSMVDDACAPHGVAATVTLGNASSASSAFTVGSAGSLMGGGVGFLARWVGLRLTDLCD